MNVDDEFDESGNRIKDGLFYGPANWFSFRIPGSLDLQQTEAFLEIKPKCEDADQSPWTMAIYAAWVDAADPQTSADSFAAASVFPDIVTSNEAEPLELPGRSRSWKGASRQSPAPSIWKRLGKPKARYEWQLWVVEYEDIIVVASLQSTLNFALDRGIRQLCRTTLDSILFAEHLACPPKLFRSRVIELSEQRFSLLKIQPVGQFSMRIGESEMNLANFYRSYLQAPDRLEEIVLPAVTMLVRMQELSPDQLMPPLHEVSDRIMPMLYPEGDEEARMSEFAGFSWVAGLKVMFVVDEDQSYRFVHKCMLERWDIGIDDLNRLAMENLEQFAEKNPLEVSVIGESETRLLMPVDTDPYNSSRLLNANLHSRLREFLGKEFVVGVPNRDFFVAVSLEHPDLIQQVRERVLQDYQAMHHPLTNRLLVISADGVSEYLNDDQTT